MSTTVDFADFDLSKLMDLSKGDVIEVPGFLAGLDPDEPVLATVNDISSASVLLRFTYYGAFIGTATLIKNAKGEFKWK